MCDGDRYDDRVTEIVDAALDHGYVLAFRQRAGGWEAAWRSAHAAAASSVEAVVVVGRTRTEAAERALEAIVLTAAA
jgi:hypothetical protein